ncbi:MAG: GTP-binding protein [Aequorivita sp.]
MPVSNQIVLRPRFNMELEQGCSEVLTLFIKEKSKQDKFIVSCIDDHIFIKLPQKQQHFWSPQLHLEITEKTKDQCSLHGFFGPNPTVWTMFMFLHVAVGILFMVNATWMYTKYNLGNAISLQIGIAIALVLLWILLYFAGAAGKKKGKPGMRELYEFMLETIS